MPDGSRVSVEVNDRDEFEVRYDTAAPEPAETAEATAVG